MAHNINENRMFYFGEKPWHGIGTELNHPATAAEAIKEARLDYTVAAEPLYRKNGREMDNLKVIVRPDTNDELGIVSNSYKIIQNVEAFNFFDSVVEEGLAMYHTAGALGKGERIWILAKLPDSVLVTKDDVVNKYLLLTTSHNGVSSLLMYFTPVRVVCQNTLNLSSTNATSGISIRHTGNIMNKVSEARRILGLAVNYYMKFDADAHAMLKYQMSDAELKKYFDYALRGNVGPDVEESTRVTNEKETLMTLFHTGKGNDLPEVRGSAWAALNAVTEYVDHYRTIKNLAADRTNRLKNIWFGSGAVVKSRAYSSISELVGVK
jgi:phage/plasmid-like protein (TIGR03299 family)